jgi:hypothetical protein
MEVVVPQDVITVEVILEMMWRYSGPHVAEYCNVVRVSRLHHPPGGRVAWQRDRISMEEKMRYVRMITAIAALAALAGCSDEVAEGTCSAADCPGGCCSARSTAAASPTVGAAVG